MKKIAILLLLCIGISDLQIVYAQKQPSFWNSDMQKIASPNSDGDWIYIKPEVIIEPASFFTTYRQAINLHKDDEMRLFKTETDKIGFTHYRYHQFYKGFRVITGEFTLHAKEGKLLTANGNITRGILKAPVIQTSRDVAFQLALQYFPAERYAWQSPQLEADYKAQHHNQGASLKPRGELVWVNSLPDSDLKDGSFYELAYMLDVYTASMQGKRIFVSAGNGKVLMAFPLTYHCTATNVTTNFYGIQVFSTRQIPGSNPASFNLWNDCQVAFVRTRNWNNDLTMAADFVSGINNSWGAAASAATSHWGTERSYAYFLNIHGRMGWNNANGGVNIYQNALFCSNPPGCTINNNANNASFGNGFMFIGNAGNANTIDDWNSLDIIAHEFTHGVIETSFGNLIYSKESGALNESFCDIFGATCHASLFGLNSNSWLVGFDRKNPVDNTTSLYIRNMSDPDDRSDPDTYLGTNWVSTTTPTDIGGDNWGVHTNSGVQNFMYYLLTSGGSGTNDNGTAYSLVGIGIVAAREIAYRALTVGYLFSTSDYAQARTAWVHAAIDLYGECSFQAIETGKAWDAVGLPPPLNNITTNVCGTYGGSLISLTKPSIFSLAPGCLMTIIPSSLVQYGARKVILNPGFRAQNGSKFRAYISDCRYAAY